MFRLNHGQWPRLALNWSRLASLPTRENRGHSRRAGDPAGPPGFLPPAAAAPEAAGQRLDRRREDRGRCR
jgi:hypothetical protein